MNGEIAIVTGATRGIGASIAKTLKKHNFTVIANYFYEHEEAQKFAKENDVHVMQWDVGNFEQCQKSVADIETKYQKSPSILINNAGITRDKMMHKMEFNDWEDVIKTNLSSCFNMSRVLINQMRNNGFGRIINISSINGLSGCAGQANYAAAKAGIIGLTKSIALENATKGITVNAIAPGYTDTPMTAKISEEILDSIVNKIPMHRLGKPEEIAETVMFLINSPYVTGATININGGLYMQ